MAWHSFPETYTTAGVYPVGLMLAAGYGNLDTYFNMPAAATHSRSKTSRGDPQQEHDQRRFRADHETIKQNAPASRASSSSDGKIVVAPDARIAVRLGQARALPGGLRLRFYIFHMLGGVPELLEVVSHGQFGVPQLRRVLCGAFGGLLVLGELLRGAGAVARRAAFRDDLGAAPPSQGQKLS